MKLLVYSPLALRSGRPQLMLAVAQKAVDEGHDVVFVSCDGSLPACVSNTPHSRLVCRYCVARQELGLARLDGTWRRRVLSDYLDRGRLRALARSRDDFGDQASLRALRHRGADVGYAALSCYVTETKEPAPDLSQRPVRETLQRLVNAGKVAYEALGAAIERERPDRVAIFNGRHSADRSVLRYCQQHDVPCDVYELTNGARHVVRLRDTMVGDVAPMVRLIEEHWARGGPEKLEVARAYYERIREATFAYAADDARSQRRRALPEGFDPGRRNVVVFASSEDEFVAIGEEWDEKVYASQAEAVARIAEGLRDAADVHVTLRLHPRRRPLDRSYTRDLTGLAGRLPNLTVVPAESGVSSHALLDAARAVVTFGSTIGMEAIYWGRPHVLLGNGYNRMLGGSYDPKTHDEVISLLSRDLEPQDPTPALKLAYWRTTGGAPHPHYDGDASRGTRHAYTFKGDRLAVRGPLRVLARLAKRRRRQALTPDAV